MFIEKFPLLIAAVFYFKLFAGLVIFHCTACGFGRGFKSLFKLPCYSSTMVLGWIFLILFGYTSCLLGVFCGSVIWATLVCGIFLFFYYRKSESIISKQFLIVFSILLPLTSIMLIRSAAPPYFTDALRYHFAICYQISKNGGFETILADWHFPAHTTYFPEIPFVFFSQWSGENALGALNVAFALACIFRARSIFIEEKLYNLNWRLSFFVICLFSSDVFFHSVVYGKTDILMYLLMIDWSYSFYIEYKKREVSNYFLFLSCFLMVYKVSNIVILALPILYMIVRGRSKVFLKVNVKTLICLIPLLLWIMHNIMTIGQPFFPIFYDTVKVPVHVLSAYREDKYSLLQKFNLLFSYFFTTFNHRIHFMPNMFFWFIIPTIISLKSILNTLVLRVIIFLLFGISILLFLHSDPIHVFRLSFPLWIMLFIYLSMSNVIRQWLIMAVFFGFISFLYLVNKDFMFLPGIRYYANQQSLSEYYRSLNYPFAAEILDNSIQSINTQGRLAFFGESPYLARSPKVIFCSPNSLYWQGANLSPENLSNNLKLLNVSHILLEGRTQATESFPRIDGFFQINPSGAFEFMQALEKAYSTGLLRLVKISPHFLLFEVKRTDAVASK